MHYLYILEGRLKYETINFDSTITFTLYNQNLDRKNESVEGDDLNYFLKSELDVVITVNLSTNKIFLSTPLTQNIQVFSKDGGCREIVGEREVNIVDDVVKFKIENADFSFLINSKVDPEIKSEKKETTSSVTKKTNKFDLSIFFAVNKMKIAATLMVIIAILSVFVFLPTKKVKINKKNLSSVLVFNNENELMKANVEKFNSSNIYVKTKLEQDVRKFLQQQGYRYIKFELEKQRNKKFNLLLYVFQKERQPFDSIENEFDWIDTIEVKKINVNQMFDDFNRLADKYGLMNLKEENAGMKYQIVEISFVNNNLRFDSIQRDLNAFYERWGKNYIEFIVSLKEKPSTPVDFLIRDGKKEIIFTDRNIYFN